MQKKPTKILWVEDNVGDILLIKEAFKEAGLTHRFTVFNNGQDALDFLFRRHRYVRAARPDLIILDLNMPRKNGREVIEEISDDPELIQIPLVILTTSRSDQTVLEGLDPTRCLYLVKPSNFSALLELAKKIQTFLADIKSKLTAQ